MSLDERFFTWIWHRSKSFRKDKTQSSTVSAVLLDQHRRSLEILLHGLINRPVPIEVADDLGGWHGSTLLLPRSMALFSDPELNAFAFRFRVLTEAVLRILVERDQWVSHPYADQGYPATLQALPELFRHMDELWPGAKSWRLQLCDHLAQDLADSSTLSSVLALLQGSSYPVPNSSPIDLSNRSKNRESAAWQQLAPLFANPHISADTIRGIPEAIDLNSDIHKKNATEKQGNAAKRLKYAEQDTKNNNPVAQVFEKTQTAESYQGSQRSFDDADDMDEHSDALDEVDFQQVIRTKGRAGSFVNMEHEGSFAAESLDHDAVNHGKLFTYPEWFDNRQRYQKNWCTVRELRPALGPISSFLSDVKVQQQGKNLRKQLESLFNRRLWITRQPDGAELDLERLVRRETDIRAGSQPDERVYMDKRVICRDVSCVILIDGSLSTDSWVHGQRVLDQLKAVLATLSLAMEGVGFPCEVASFYSQTRQDCRYQLLKEFAEPWSQLARRLDSLEPTGYTRIGPAIRHSTARLQKNKAKHRLILLLSDAKPTDFDAYEGRHGIRDVRKAVVEAERDDIRIRALTVSNSKTRQVFSMFEPGAVHFLGKRDDLALQVFHIFLQLLLHR